MSAHFQISALYFHKPNTAPLFVKNEAGRKEHSPFKFNDIHQSHNPHLANYFYLHTAFCYPHPVPAIPCFIRLLSLITHPCLSYRA